MDYHGVELKVIQGDALRYSSDLLVLKYAQASYGVDKRAIDVAGIDAATLPALGENLLIQEPSGLAPRNLLLLGVQPIAAFDYRSIREFSRRAIVSAARLSLPVHEISMTMHGIGFGLDETEAFESEIAGIVEALDSGQYPQSLLAVSIIEKSHGRADRIRDSLVTLLSSDDAEKETAEPYAIKGKSRLRRIDSVGYDSAERPHAFAAVPFRKSYEDVFYYAIDPSIRAVGLLCEKMDEISFTGDIVDRMRKRIASSKVIVADLSGANPNVYLEVGYAWGVNVPCILVCNRKTDLAFDLRGQRCIFYSTIRELETNLSAELRALTIYPKAARVFCAYATEDKQLKDKLSDHLGGLGHGGYISEWTDCQIVPGQKLAPEIIRQLDEADIILLLITFNLLRSEFTGSVEIARALERNRHREAIVIPVILKPAGWQHAGLAGLQALPKDGKPVTTWSETDAAYLDIAQGLRRAIYAWRTTMTDLDGKRLVSIRSVSVPNGGTARGYQGIFTSLAALQLRLSPDALSPQHVSLYIAAPEVNIRFCRVPVH